MFSGDLVRFLQVLNQILNTS